MDVYYNFNKDHSYGLTGFVGRSEECQNVEPRLVMI